MPKQNACTGSAGDPASLGIPAAMIGISIPEYEEATQRQIHVLLEQTARRENDAISHRTKNAELWSDSIYMVPPFLAYIACMRRDANLLIEAARQCILYRDVLLSNSGLWTHIASQALVTAVYGALEMGGRPSA
jgi:rhamnogalacturonyl hydrolase YesR